MKNMGTKSNNNSQIFTGVMVLWVGDAHTYWLTYKQIHLPSIYLMMPLH